jgi:hypothetical protein
LENFGGDFPGIGGVSALAFAQAPLGDFRQLSNYLGYTFRLSYTPSFLPGFDGGSSVSGRGQNLIYYKAEISGLFFDRVRSLNLSRQFVEDGGSASMAKPVVGSHPRCKVRWWVRGFQTGCPSRRGLVSSVTRI